MLSFEQTTQQPLAAIFGCAGLALTEEERNFFHTVNPLGFILFTRNIESPTQVVRLISHLREVVGREDAPVLIDQEGGRVQRLRFPHWHAIPSAARFAELYERDPERGIKAIRLNTQIVAADLRSLGITVNCAPVLDLRQPGADLSIGDRAYGVDPKQVAALGGAVCDVFLDSGVSPIVKHIPGQGRALVDSHKALPVIETSAEELQRSDFAPFRALSAAHSFWAMTAHVIYTAFDTDRPATVSRKVIREIVRGYIGFDGLLISDDLDMKALSGTYEEKTTASLDAGCDVVLQCSGNLKTMRQVAENCRKLDDKSVERFIKAKANRPMSNTFDRKKTLHHLNSLLNETT